MCFFPEGAVEFYRAVKPHGIDASEPEVSNGLWATELNDPDGNQLLFESPTDLPEGTRLSEVSVQSAGGTLVNSSSMSITCVDSACMSASARL